MKEEIRSNIHEEEEGEGNVSKERIGSPFGYGEPVVARRHWRTKTVSLDKSTSVALINSIK